MEPNETAKLLRRMAAAAEHGNAYPVLATEPPMTATRLERAGLIKYVGDGLHSLTAFGEATHAANEKVRVPYRRATPFGGA